MTLIYRKPNPIWINDTICNRMADFAHNINSIWINDTIYNRLASFAHNIDSKEDGMKNFADKFSWI